EIRNKRYVKIFFDHSVIFLPFITIRHNVVLTVGRPSISEQLKQLADILSIFDVLVAHLLPKSVCRIKAVTPFFAFRTAGPIFSRPVISVGFYGNEASIASIFAH
ncbi:MAG: hypothetical protein KJ573_13975, partial [Proteobacteria bacterium]|nr:hypothetical protein [Pseudomonadota bacterium]MBU1904683.1 hypothetical protein [Pseudomonadota bacterium]